MLSVKSLTYQWDELNLYFEMIRAQSLDFVIPQILISGNDLSRKKVSLHGRSLINGFLLPESILFIYCPLRKLVSTFASEKTELQRN